MVAGDEDAEARRRSTLYEKRRLREEAALRETPDGVGFRWIDFLYGAASGRLPGQPSPPYGITTVPARRAPPPPTAFSP